MLSSLPTLAATNALSGPDEIPPLRPPKPELVPGFWEQHGVLLAVSTCILVLVIVLLWRLFARPKPPVIPAPDEVARQALEALQQRPEDKATLAEVSAILRRYFIAAFKLPNEEVTNSELCRKLERHPTVGEELSNAATGLLEGMEHRRFDTETSPSETRAAELALLLIDQAEAQLKPPPDEVDPATASA